MADIGMPNDSVARSDSCSAEPLSSTGAVAASQGSDAHGDAEPKRSAAFKSTTGVLASSIASASVESLRDTRPRCSSGIARGLASNRFVGVRRHHMVEPLPRQTTGQLSEIESWWRVASKGKAATAGLDVPLLDGWTSQCSRICTQIRGSSQKKIQYHSLVVAQASARRRFGRRVVMRTSPPRSNRTNRFPRAAVLVRVESVRGRVSKSATISISGGGVQ